MIHKIGRSFLILFLLVLVLLFPGLQGRLYGREKAVKNTAGTELARIRKTFVNGVMALENGNFLIARLEFDNLDESDYVLGDYLLYYRIRAENESGDHATALLDAGRFLEGYPESLLNERVRIEQTKALIVSEQFARAGKVIQDLQAAGLSEEPARQVDLLAGEAAAGMEDWEEAYDLYQQLAFQFPETEEGEEAERRREIIAEKLKSPPKAPDAKLFLTRVRELFRALKYPRVIETCREMEKTYPQGIATDQALLLKARVLSKQGRFSEGGKLMKKVIREAGAASIQAEALYWLGNSSWNRQENSSARREFQRLLKRYPESKWSIKALYAMGRIYETAKKTSKAREY